MKKILLISLAAFAALTVSCGKVESDGHSSEPQTVSVTQWTKSMELFLEYPQLVAGQPIKFIIHLTTLADFQPVREGRILLSFRYGDGRIISEETRKLLRVGIFTPQIVLPEAGNCLFSIEYSGPAISETFTIGSVAVHASESGISPDLDERVAGITFLKEQQWRTRFSTEALQSRRIRPSVTAIGVVKPRQESFAIISSPVSGILSIDERGSIAIPGQRVSRGEVLAVLTPPLHSEKTWMEGYLGYQSAGRDYHRALRLRETRSLSQREFEAIEQKYLTLKAGYRALAGRLDSEIDTLGLAEGRFQIRSPFAGVVSDVWVYPGQKVEADERLMSVVNSEKVWLQMNIYENDYYRLQEIDGLSLQVPGLEQEIHIPKPAMVVLARSETINAANRTIPFLLEVVNAGRVLKIGQSITVRLFMPGRGQYPAVPNSSIFEDRGRSVVFVQTGGESFEKRFIETGATDLNWVAVEKGLNEGDRVVTQGGYMVKLASTSEVIGHAHTH